MSYVAKITKGIMNAVRGLRYTVQREKIFRFELGIGVGLVIVGYLLQPLAPSEIFALIIAYALLLIAELVNTAIETLLNVLHPDQHEGIGASKDTASAGVLVALILLGALVALMVASRFM